MIVGTSYREGDATALVNYVNKDYAKLRDRSGRELSDREISALVDQSEHYQMERSVMLSPERPDELSEREFDRATRRTMREWADGRPSARWVYAVHEPEHDDCNQRHAHAIAVGTKNDLYMDIDDIQRVREHGQEYFREQDRARQRQRDRPNEQQQGQGHALDR